MKKYARVVDGVAVELIELPADWDLANVYVPEIAATIFPAASKVKEGWLYDGSAFADPPEPAAPSLDEVKADLKKGVDHDAETERLKYITAGAGQAMTYQEKFAELVAYEADTNPVKANYPMMSAEIGITASSLTGVAAAIRGAYDLWKQIGGAIEIARLKAKSDIDKATTENAARTAADVTWPSAG